jgi:hypothetical protein
LVGDHASTMGDDMTEALAPPFLERVDAPREQESVQSVEIVVHDRDSTRILLEYAAPLFPAEVVPGSAWTVRLQPPKVRGWILELLSLIERWLESARLPCAKVLYRGRSYLIRTSPDLAGPSTVTDITSTGTLMLSRGSL